MKGNSTGGALLLLFAWLLFRCVSDWGRGLRGSDVDVAEWSVQLSYYGLVVWLIVATPTAVLSRRTRELLRGDRIVTAHAMFIAVQLIAFGIVSARFGMKGFVAGAYIVGVSISFLYAYILGVRVAEVREQPVAALRRNLLILASAVGPTMLIALVQLLTGTGRDVEGEGSLRLYGGTSSPNILGAMMIAFMAALVWTDSRRLELNRLLLGVAALVTFVACFSLTGFGALAFGAVLYFILRARRTGRIHINLWWVIGGLVALYLIAALAGAVLSARLGQFSESDNSLAWRVRTWFDYFDTLSDPKNLLFGAGLGIDHLEMDQEPHNEWLRVTTEAGLVGLAFFTLTWVRLFGALRRLIACPDQALQQQATALLGATAGLLIWGLADAVLRTAPSALLVWTIAGLLVGSARSYYAPAEAAPPARAFADGTGVPVVGN
jgi:hypothetical protein